MLIWLIVLCEDIDVDAKAKHKMHVMVGISNFGKGSYNVENSTQ